MKKIQSEINRRNLSGTVFSPHLQIVPHTLKHGSPCYILGINTFFHDAAACLLKDDRVVFAAEEERFNRRKHYTGFPKRAISECLKSQNLTMNDIDLVVFYEDPILKLRRILTHNNKNEQNLLKKIQGHMAGSLSFETILRSTFGYTGPIEYMQHHYSHAASAFFPSPFEEAAILTVDAVGEYSTANLFYGKGNTLKRMEVFMDYPHSLGMLYSSLTAYLGFKVNNDEYKVMGLASYGKPLLTDAFRKLINDCSPTSFNLNMDYFVFDKSDESIYNKEAWSNLFGFAPRVPESSILEEHKNLAATLQCFTEEILVAMAREAKARTNSNNLCFAGGVALNGVANEKILKHSGFKQMFVQPAAGDAGGSVGAAMLGYFGCLGNIRKPHQTYSTLLGPEYSNDSVREMLEEEFTEYQYMEDDALMEWVADRIFKNKIVGWFQGRMEYGPRALGCRSILANPCNPEMQDILNLRVKHREDFRPFAPAILAEESQKYFDFPSESPYMLFVAPVHEDKKAKIPAVTHVDGSARLQTVTESENPRFYRLIKTFEKISGVPVFINTSFNVRGEPIVCTPRDAFNCFLTTGIDILVLENCVVEKKAV